MYTDQLTKTNMAATWTDVCCVLLVAVVAVVVLAVFVIQIIFMILALLARCKNLRTIITISAVGLFIQSLLVIALYKGITGCRYRVDERYVNNTFLFNYIYQHGLEKNSEYMKCCGDFRLSSVVLSVIIFIALLHQKSVNSLPNNKQRRVLFSAILYFSVITCVMGWIYWTPGRDVTLSTFVRSLSTVSLPTCPHAARVHVLPVLVETLFIYGPALYMLLIPRNQPNGQPESQLECTIFKHCLTNDGSHCAVCCGANGLLRDSFLFYTLIMLVFRPFIYIYYSVYNDEVAEIFVFGCNLLIPIVLAVNATPYIGRVFQKPTHVDYDDALTTLNVIKM
ncbi:uncharacterized protein LOC117339433 [Pecten maximus]|uniref:uncharacterized protein LOC117339433 n=1 Tax=Pecten maximus TaxID=6579 RepID=UPI001458161A|nr:uncharacterized protein LOC117339433 [Pecten maximus]